MGAHRQRNPRRILSEVEREELEQQIQKEEERMREEREQNVRVLSLTKEQRRIRGIIRCRISRHQAKMIRGAADENYRKKGVTRRQSDEETRKPDVESQLPAKAPPSGRPKQTMSEEERRVREKWEQQIQEEEERMREEREQNVFGINLTKEQRRIRNVINQRARQLRARTQREAEAETFTQGRQEQVLSEEEQRLRAEREQAEEKLMREEREQHIPRLNTLTDQQRKDRARIRRRNRYRLKRVANDEKYPQKKMAKEEERRLRSEREQAEEKLMREEQEQLTPWFKPLTDQQREDRGRIRARNRRR
ncbi:hypothetical protein MMC22_010675 [Lobaria immixta]|nr:hypothetical protein [Lobaria immixta]